MSLLTIYRHAKPTDRQVIRDPDDIARRLHAIGVTFERWEADQPLADDADQETILKAYSASVARLMNQHGFKSADVISIAADFPGKAALRAKFLSEHTHSEFEVRFFVDGHGLFYLHPDEHVYAVYCQQGDLLSVPANMKHWFDSGAEPHIKAIRLFTSTEGWVAQYTGDTIADRLPKIEQMLATSANGTGVIRAIVTDIEGTTSSLYFVKDVLFPYAREHLGEFVHQHGRQAEVQSLLQQVSEAVGKTLSEEEAIEQLRSWMDEDRKVTPLKSLQGLIWEAGYRNGDYQGHIYHDAAEALRQWQAQGLRLYVYSSGSVYAQKLLFAHTAQGDLTPLFNGYFDTHIGAKQEADAYRRIAADIGLPPAEILFLSDIEGELDAAAAAGMATFWLVRDGELYEHAAHRRVRGFDQIEFTAAPSKYSLSH